MVATKECWVIKKKRKKNQQQSFSEVRSQWPKHGTHLCKLCSMIPGSVTENGLWNDRGQQHKSTTKIRPEHVKSSWGQSQAFRKQHKCKTSLGRALIHLVTRIQRVHADNVWCTQIYTGSRAGIQALHKALTAPL